MKNNYEIVYYPLEVEKEISFMLYNYENIEDLINSRKEELIDKMNVTSSAWLRSKNIGSNTLEDIVIKLQNDKKLKRLKKWQIFLDKYVKGLKEYDIPIYYNFVDMKYFKKYDKKEIMNKLELNNDSYEGLKIRIIWVVYYYAVKEKLYKEMKT